jgi:RHH-type proline utilization regulon transcriptional repressor/proline dehydrogenase/delta 1-pyrroline-5-carboxylate dehydrogenase
MDRICSLALVGNIYLNRNQIGAVVGVQPFGGEGLSGTGPKAGGPHYLYRFLKATAADQESSSRDSAPVATELVLAVGSVADYKFKNRAQAAINRVSAVVREPRILSGPTGERNTYTLHPRGTVVCAGGGDDGKAALVTQCVLSAMAGNRVIIPDNPEHADVPDRVRKFLVRAGIDASNIILSKDNLLRVCSAQELDLVITDDEEIVELRRILAARTGARIPVLCSSDPAQLLFMERVVSEDTTASGGNAKLLAGV